MAQPTETPAIECIGPDGSQQYYYDSEVHNDFHSQWRHPGPTPVRNTPSPSGSGMATPIIFSDNQAISPSIHSQDGMLSSNFRGIPRLAVPGPPGYARSTISNPSESEHAVSSMFPYQSSFPSNSPSTSMLSNTGQGISVMDGTHHPSNIGSLSLRMYSNDQHGEPWNPMRVAYSDAAVERSSFPGPNIRFGNYRQQQASDIESVVGPRSDSGYFTHPAPQSVISNEPERADQDLPSGMFEISHLNVNSAPSDSTTEYLAAPQSDQGSVYSANSRGQSKTILPCPKCKEVSKCPSDYKKHMLKHDKPHTCDVQGCRRAAQGKGFTTINDLMRHKKSVHRIGVERDSYQCAAEHCRNKGKIWPRLDNFKQHISRMHKDEDETDLIRKSAYRSQALPSQMTQADMLAGIGIEAQAAGNELDDPASGLSLTPDQDDDNPWATSFDPGSHNYELDHDRLTRREDDRRPRASNLHTESKDRTQSNTPLSSISRGTTKTQPQHPLKVGADVASNQPTLIAATTLSQLSSAPQTKAEQQRQTTQIEQQRLALQKFGKALIAQCQADPSVDGPDLQDVVLRMLAGTSHQRRSGSNATSQQSENDPGESDDARSDTIMTKTEALKASQAISNLIKQSRASPVLSQSRRSSRVSSSEKLQCKHCEVTLARACDMKKHLKRHTKPYGCTYPKCHKRFGAKSDWKRHENSQHFQMESFRCQRTDTVQGKPCGELFQRVGLFKQHLVNEHKVPEDFDISSETKACLIGKNYQRQFWCGFCESIVKLKTRRNAAWDERFDHIDNHFNKEKRSIELWLCVETRRTKGESLREIDHTKFDDDDGDEDGDGEPDDSPPPATNGSGGGAYPPYDAFPAAPPIPPSMTDGEIVSRKRQAPVEDFTPAPVPKRRRKDVDRYCCSCGYGPWQTNIYEICMDCNHRFCSSCVIDGIVGGVESGMMHVLG